MPGFLDRLLGTGRQFNGSPTEAVIPLVTTVIRAEFFHRDLADKIRCVTIFVHVNFFAAQGRKSVCGGTYVRDAASGNPRLIPP